MPNSAVTMLNYIRQNASRQYQDLVPVATEDNISTIGNVLLNDSYQPQLNEFITTLINRIALTIIRNQTFANPLARFKKGSMPLGTDIQDIITNPAEAEAYEYSNAGMAKLLTITDPDTKVAYYQRNRKDLYTKTISREGLQGAFVSWDKFNQFITGIVQSLYNGNYISEFNYTKGLVRAAYDNNKVITEVVTTPTNEATGKAFLKKARTLYRKFLYPSTQYNAYTKFSGANGTVTTWTTPERIVLIMRADVMAEIDVDVLAAAFNMSNADFLGRVIEVDDFGDDKILGVMCDESWLQIYDSIFRFDEFYNARTMSWNEYLHAWGTFAISPFANAVLFCTAESKPVTAITASDVSITGTAQTESLSITLTPADATSDIQFMSSNEQVFTVAKVSNTSATITSVGVGEANLGIVADNGVSKEITVTVTAGE